MNSTVAYETSAVIFLDILGTAARTDFAEKLKVHKLFHEEVKSNKERQNNLPHVIYQRDLRSFSDCAYVIYTYKSGIEEARKDDLNLLFISLYNTSISVLRIINEGFLVRGGAALGNSYIDELGFFGPSIEMAHYLEENVALYPRVLIESVVGQQLFDWERSKEMDEDMEMLFESTPRLILKDDEGKFFLNLFYELEKSAELHLDDDSLTLEQLKEQIRGIIDRDERESKDQRVLDKLDWMRRFTESSKVLLKDEFVKGSSSIVL